MTMLLTKIQALEVELHHGGLQCSRTRVDNLLHSDFYEVSRSGVRYERAFVVDVLGGQDSAPKSVADEFELQQITSENVLLTYRTARINAQGELIDHALRCSLWTHKNGQWQLRYHQGTPAAKKW
ncbi:DUF4440 domain-containing protein [Halioxenophilus aromaticivorans]|uniref:DUF4440 domain-containing protein n=1 Tax=Halioxenophilus aromaticivorans TaxID=1306992 RepID=A0AAV3U5C7_9ALTE